jgi:hypothetical protein
MRHWTDRPRRFAPLPRGARFGPEASSRRYGCDEPALWRGIDTGAFVFVTLPAPKARRAAPPGNAAGRAARWLFARGGMSLVLLVGLVVLGVLGGVLSGR